MNDLPLKENSCRKWIDTLIRHEDCVQEEAPIEDGYTQLSTAGFESSENRIPSHKALDLSQRGLERTYQIYPFE